MALDARQRRAIEQLAAGSTITDAAHAIGVARETLSRWVNHDKDFGDELDKMNDDIAQGVQRQYAALYETAFSGLEQLAKSTDESVRLKAIVLILANGPGAHGKGGDAKALPVTPEEEAEATAIATKLLEEQRAKTNPAG